MANGERDFGFSNSHSIQPPVSRSPFPVSLVEDLFRHQAAQIVSTLTRILGWERMELAEDAVQEAMIRALRSWPYHGVPQNPPGWLMTVARNQARDLLRRERALRAQHDALLQDYDARQQQLEAELEAVTARADDELRDDQLRMMFACCHPALAREARVALTLKTLAGFGVPEIARAFLGQEATIAQRLVRAKRLIRERDIPLDVPDAHDLSARLDSVLEVLYLLFNEGYSAAQGEDLVRHELCAEAVRLCAILAEHPAGDVPKVHALLALLLLQGSRLPARTDTRGNVLLLEEQDRARWDRRMIVAGLRELARASTGDELTVYHLQAGIAAVHAAAPNYAATDWPRILDQYDDLLALQASPVAALNRAVALAMVHGPQAGLVELERVRAMPGMEAYFLLHVTAAEFFRRSGDVRRAIENYHRAQSFNVTEPERRFVARKLAEVSETTESSV